MSQTAGMIALRHILMPLLLLLLLPWGTFANAPPSADTAGVATDQTVGHDAAVSPGKRKCRSGVLPGSPCGPDIGVLPDHAFLAGAPAGTLSRQHGAWRSAGHIRAPLTGPPRFS